CPDARPERKRDAAVGVLTTWLLVFIGFPGINCQVTQKASHVLPGAYPSVVHIKKRMVIKNTGSTV
ncbi:MAG: hypothetical protein ACNA78_10490, partial [Balneolaceae bacterium]